MASPYELWRQAGGGTSAYDRDAYHRLVREHGCLVPLEPGEQSQPLPCGWPGTPSYEQPRPPGGYLGDWDRVPVRYVGGPLDGETTDLDDTENECREQIGATWDFTPRSINSDAPDVIERYQLGKDDDGWVWQHVGTFERPVLERNIDAVFVGGPRDGQTIRFLGSIRDQPQIATAHARGYRLVHTGEHPLEGWQMVPIEDVR